MTDEVTELKPAAQVEADGDPTVTVDYGGAAFVFPSSIEDVDGDVIDAVDDQKISYVLHALLGDERWAEFKKTKPKMRDYLGLFTAYAKAIGLEITGN